MTVYAELPSNAWRALVQMAGKDGVSEWEFLRQLMAAEQLRRALEARGRPAAEVEIDEDVLPGTEDLAPRLTRASRERQWTMAVVGVAVLVTVGAAWWILATMVKPLTFAEVQAYSLALLAALGLATILSHYFPTRRRASRSINKDRVRVDEDDD